MKFHRSLRNRKFLLQYYYRKKVRSCELYSKILKFIFKTSYLEIFFILFTLFYLSQILYHYRTRLTKICKKTHHYRSVYNYPNSNRIFFYHQVNSKHLVGFGVAKF